MTGGGLYLGLGIDWAHMGPWVIDDWISIPWSLLSRCLMIGSILNEYSSIANVLPWHLALDRPDLVIASQAMAMPWVTCFSPPDMSCRGEMVLDMVDLIQAGSTPVISLKSTFKTKSFLLSEISRLLDFLPGLLQNTTIEVLWLGDGLWPWKMAVIAVPRRSQCFW